MADEEEWPDTEAGGGDAYGDTLDTGWMSGLRGQKLLREAEALIFTAMLRREDPARPCLWRDVFARSSSSGPSRVEPDGGGEDDEGEAVDIQRFMNMTSVRDAWAKVHPALSGPELSAVCLRFGPSYGELQTALAAAEQSLLPNDRPFQRRKAWDAFSPKQVMASLSLVSTIDTSELTTLLADAEARLEIVEVQITRAGATLDAKRGDSATPEALGELLRLLGLPSMGPKNMLPLCQSAMVFARMQPGLPCPLGRLEAYCIARVAQKSNAGKSSAKAQFRALLRPVTHRLEQQLGDMQLGGAGDGNDDNEEESTKRAASVHALLLLDGMPKNTSDAVPLSVFLPALLANNPHLSPAFLRQLCALWGSPEDSVTAAVLEAFFHPEGFSLRVRMPAPLAGFRLRGKLSGTDSCQLIYAVCTKQLFAKLRQARRHDTTMRVPSDVVLYADAERERRIPRSKAAIAKLVDDGGRVFVHSQYALDLFEQVRVRVYARDRVCTH